MSVDIGEAMNGSLLIQNTTMILPNRIVEGDLRVSKGLIKTMFISEILEIQKKKIWRVVAEQQQQVE